MDNLELVMSWLGMSQYIDRFKEAGFDSWETVMWITEDDLESLGVEVGFRRKLQKEIAKSQRLAQESAPAQPMYELAPLQQYPGDPSPPDYEEEHPTKRGYKHHPKPDPNAPERPYSAYVLFSNHTRDELRAQNLSFSNLSKQVGERWQAISLAEKERWKQRGAGPWEEYKARLAEYRKTDQYQEYQNYVAKFKAAQDAKKPARKQGATHPGRTMAPDPAYTTSIASGSDPKQRLSCSSSGGQAEPIQYDNRAAMKRPRRDVQSWAAGQMTTPTRVRRACDSCRRKKVKCDGNQPKCRNCRNNILDCHYEDSKSGTQRNIENLWQKVKAYEAILLQLVPKVDDDDQQAIHDAMHLPPQLESSREAIKEESISESKSEGGGAESEASGVGSMGSTDRVNEQHFAREGEFMAFEGQASDTKWLQKLRTRLDEEDDTDLAKPKSAIPLIANPSPNAMRFRVNNEDADMSVVGNQIYPLELPIRSTADNLVEAYFATVQPSFPMFDRAEFMLQYQEVYNSPDLAVYGDRNFIATLHLVFGIGAVHAHLVGAEWAGDERDHMLYIASSRMLAVDSGILNDLCYLGQVQVFALGALYLLATDQINRSWNLTGLAIRAAQAIGLHLMNVTPPMPDSEKDHRARVWFAIASLENILTVITGRPSMVKASDCSVPILRVLEEESQRSSTEGASSGYSQQTSPMDFSNQGSMPSAPASSDGRDERGHPSIPSIYFKHYTELCNLAKEVVGELYSPGIRSKKWKAIQNIIEAFDKRLFHWRNNLTPPFDAATPPSDAESASCSIALRILFYSTRTIINRPCLCRINDHIVGQSRSSKQTNRTLAKNCVDSARAVLNLIVNTPEAAVLRRGVTWWMMLHHLKRGIIVLLLELSYRSDHMPAYAGEILTEAKTAINWLHQMRSSSPQAKHTWLTLSRLLYRAAQRVGGDTSDIITEDPSPPALDPSFTMDFGSHAPSGNPLTHQQQHQQPSGAYDPNDSNIFPPLGLYEGFAQSDWDEFGFEGPQGMGGVGGFFPLDQEMGGQSGESFPPGGALGTPEGGGGEVVKKGWRIRRGGNGLGG